MRECAAVGQRRQLQPALRHNHCDRGQIDDLAASALADWVAFCLSEAVAARAALRPMIDSQPLELSDAPLVLRTYPCRATARRAACAFLKASRPPASCSRARWFSAFFDQRMSSARLRFSQEWQASTTHRLARQPGVESFSLISSPRLRTCASKP